MNNHGRLQDLVLLFRIPYGHANEFLRNSWTIWTRALKKVRQPSYRLTFTFTLNAFLRYSCELTCECIFFVSSRCIVSTTIALSFK